MNSSGCFGGTDNTHSEFSEAKVVVLPIPFDGTSTWIKGADKGPFAILEASQALELYDIETDSEVYKKGIHTCEALKADVLPEEMVKKVREKVSELLRSDKFVVSLGGEHSVTIGAVKAYKEKYNNLSVLQLDAHADLRDEYQGSKFNHACVMSRVKEIALTAQVGIRSIDIEEKEKIDDASVFFARDIVAKEEKYIDKVLNVLTDDVYITIDLDVFDPAIMPSTGTPEPGGLLWYQVLELLKNVSEKKNIVGFDIVELCPNESNKAPDFTAAKLIYKLLSYVFCQG